MKMHSIVDDFVVWRLVAMLAVVVCTVDCTLNSAQPRHDIEDHTSTAVAMMLHLHYWMSSVAANM